jgi:hypothetical protein
VVWGLNEAEEAAFGKGIRDADGRFIALGNAAGYVKNYILTMGDATRAWAMTLRDTLPLVDKLAQKMRVAFAPENRPLYCFLLPKTSIHRQIYQLISQVLFPMRP